MRKGSAAIVIRVRCVATVQNVIVKHVRVWPSHNVTFVRIAFVEIVTIVVTAAVKGLAITAILRLRHQFMNAMDVIAINKIAQIARTQKMSTTAAIARRAIVLTAFVRTIRNPLPTAQSFATIVQVVS